MGANICMNEACRTTTSLEWKKGWVLKSGGWATLCQTCGIAYENLVFCDTFHLEEAGWRECRICGKRLHCGCVASKFLHECLDFGGVGCVKCAKRLESRSIRPTQILGDEIPNVTLPEIVQSAIANGSGRKFDAAGLMQMANAMDVNGPRQLFVPQKDNTIASLGQMKGKEIIPYAEVNECFNNFNQPSGGSSMFVSPEQIRSKQGVKDMFESLAQPSLNFSLSTPMSSSTSMLPFPGGVAEGSEQNKASGTQQGQPARHILPKPPKPGQTTSSEPNKGFVTKIRVARPPAEGRGRHQLLPRYWPRITDQEIQQISGDLKSTISPLFEKILSASDAGRIGRLVLPKACAEAYFPTINQSEGVPIKIQDVKGKEWTFQFRFWPNNNSRMYVLEGVTPCIQNMQLQAGDTVTFSRIEPSGQLVMGFRKANIGDAPDAQTMLVPIRGSSGETSVSGASDNMVTNVSRASETEKKKTRNIGPKNKRLLMHNDDANEVRVTWEEAQELLRPAPNAKPTVVTIDGFEIEEYDEPPVFGKKTVFTALASGEQEQWAECDSCSKWRKLPVHVLLPAKWTCAENVWDSKRSSCSAPDDITAKELDALNRASKDFKRSKMGESSKVVEDSEPTGLDALATAAVLGDNVVNMVEPSSDRPTTRHPRHRVGCSCIVCIQPPSGKNKHHPSCKCNVCILVKRRFKTLMQRRKRQQQEQQQQRVLKRSSEMKGTGTAAAAGHGHAVLQPINRASDRERSLSLVNGRKMEVGESSSKGQLDLNCHPSREDDMLAEAAAGMNLTSLMNAAGIPLDVYLKQNAVPNLSYNLLPNAAGAGAGESEGGGSGGFLDEAEDDDDDDDDEATEKEDDDDEEDEDEDEDEDDDDDDEDDE